MIIKIGPIRADSANLLANDFVAGLPSPGAALGFAGALIRHAGIPDWSHRVLMILHSVEIRNGRPRAHPGVKSGTPTNIEIKEGVSGSVILTVVVDSPHFVEEEILSMQMNFMRFAGGVIAPWQCNGQVTPLFLDQCVEILDPHVTLPDLNLPRGYALCPPQPDRAADLVSFGDYSTLRKIRDRAYSYKKGQGWHVPVACGYRLLEDPSTAAEPRLGSRGAFDRYPHVFAEPAVGLGEFISIRDSSLSGSLSELDRYMWKWDCDFARRLIMFSTTHLRLSTQEKS